MIIIDIGDYIKNMFIKTFRNTLFTIRNLKRQYNPAGDTCVSFHMLGSQYFECRQSRGWKLVENNEKCDKIRKLMIRNIIKNNEVLY